MARIRLLTSVAGDGPVTGKRGDVIDVDADTARVWADGERAERVAPPRKPERPEKGRSREAAATVTRPEDEVERR